jgi:hypothetical protein
MNEKNGAKGQIKREAATVWETAYNATGDFGMKEEDRDHVAGLVEGAFIRAVVGAKERAETAAGGQ